MVERFRFSRALGEQADEIGGKLRGRIRVDETRFGGPPVGGL